MTFILPSPPSSPVIHISNLNVLFPRPCRLSFALPYSITHPHNTLVARAAALVNAGAVLSPPPLLFIIIIYVLCCLFLLACACVCVCVCAWLLLRCHLLYHIISACHRALCAARCCYYPLSRSLLPSESHLNIVSIVRLRLVALLSYVNEWSV